MCTCPSKAAASQLATPYCRVCGLQCEKLTIGSNYILLVYPLVFSWPRVCFLLFVARCVWPEGAWQQFAAARKTAAGFLYMTISCPNHFESSPVSISPVLPVFMRANVYNGSLSHGRIREKRRAGMLYENKSCQNATECVNCGI